MLGVLVASIASHTTRFNHFLTTEAVSIARTYDNNPVMTNRSIRHVAQYVPLERRRQAYY